MIARMAQRLIAGMPITTSLFEGDSMEAGRVSRQPEETRFTAGAEAFLSVCRKQKENCAASSE
jgi:hypothetical protein